MDVPAFTGFEPPQSSLSRLVPALEAGTLTLLASRTTIGKSALAMDLVRSALVEDRLPVLFCSGREDEEELGVRLISGLMGVDNTDLKQATPPARERLQGMKEELIGLPLDVLFSPRLTLDQVSERLDKRTANMVVVDDTDALSEPTLLLDPEAATTYALRLRELARCHQACVLVLAQLDRIPEAEYGRAPVWGDLGVRLPLARECETVMLIHRAEHYDPADRPGQVDVHVVKNADRPTGTATLAAHLPTSTFTDLPEEPEPEEELPPVALNMHTEDPGEQMVLRTYWERTPDNTAWTRTVSQVRSEYGLTAAQLQQLVREEATASVTGHACIECGAWLTAAHRTAYDEIMRRWSANHSCEQCQALERERQARRAQERALHRGQALAEAFPMVTAPCVRVEDLSLFRAVGLHALFNDPAVEGDGLTTPTFQWPRERPWAPATVLVDFERRLVHEDPATIFAHHDSPNSAFAWEEDEPSGSFYLGRVSYHLVGEQPRLTDRSPALLEELNRTFRTGPWPRPWLEQWPELWDELVLAYTSQYLDMKLNEHHLTMKQGKGTRAALSDVLATFTMGQAFNLIYRATRDAAAYYQRGGVSKPQAANSTVGRISGSADRIRANGWDIKSFNMPWTLPMTAFGEVFFHKVMWQPEMIHADVGEVRPPAHAITPADREPSDE